MPADPHVPPPVASEGPAAAVRRCAARRAPASEGSVAAVRRGAARRAPAGGAGGANGLPMAARATGSWEDALALAAGGSAHDDSQPLAGVGRLRSDELLALTRTGQKLRGLRQRHGTFGGRPLTLWDFTKRAGVHWLHDPSFKILFVAAWNYCGICPSIDECTFQNDRHSGA